MKKPLLLLSFVLLIAVQKIVAQTSWTGTVSTNWKTAGNWTAGVPTSGIDVIIGDANFTGSFQPALLSGTAACRSLTIGTSSIACTLSVGRNFNVNSNLVIGSNGTILQNTSNRTITVKGNWTNSGTYSATSANTAVTFSGTAQTITGATTFNNMNVNAGCAVTLATNISINGTLTVNGTLDPAASFVVSGPGTMTVSSTGSILVKTATFGGNYALAGGVNMNARGTVNYASSTVNQDVSTAFTYGYLRISGGMTKSISGNLPALNSTSSSSGRIYVDAGTFDLQGFTADRGTTVAGGSIVIATGATLKIGGTNSFPANYGTITISSSSTIDYYGDNQVVPARAYGNLVFESSSGVAVKTMPATAMTIAGNFTALAGSGAGVSFTAGNNLVFNRDVTLGASTTFDGAGFAHTFKGNWTNNGTFTGNTSSATFTGTNAVLSGTGTNNFYNLIFTGAGISSPASTAFNVSGNIATSGSGVFTHAANGNVTLSGTGKTISGNGLNFYNCLVPGSITCSSNFSVAGDFTVDGTFTAASSSVVKLTGASKTISGTGSMTFYTLNILGTISTADGFTMLHDFTVANSASFTATAGTVTMNGASVLSGRADLFDITINAAKSLRLGTNSIMGIADVFTNSGTLNVTTSIPNTVIYNSATAQTIVNTAYNNLVLDNGGTKTPAGNFSINRDLTINAGVSFNASTFTISVYRNFTNSGTFTAGTSTFQLLGSGAGTISGATTFNNLTENKSSANVPVNLASAVTTNNLTMTAGNMQTGSSTITITGTRSGNGIIIGTITHAHAFVSGTPYYFEGPQNAITFTTPSASLNSVTVQVITGTVANIDPATQSVNREYRITIPAGTYTAAKFRYHYEDNELNAFSEPFLALYKYNSGIQWDSVGYTLRSTTSNYVELSGMSNLPGRYTCAGVRNVVRWNGAVSSAWEDPANWTTVSGSNMANRIPSSTDAAQMGQAAFTNQPALNSNQQIGLLEFGSVQPVTLTISSGTLDDLGTIHGIWSGPASHVLDAAAGTVLVGTNLDLDDGIPGHDIALKIGSGSVSVTHSVNQQSGGAINFTGNGTLTISGDYNYTAGSFTAGSGTVIYSGAEAQDVAPLTYNNLSFTKSSERARIHSPLIVNGNFTTSIGGEVEAIANLTVGGDITIGASTNFIEDGITINAAGNFTTNGLFTVANGTVNFNGNGTQNVNANTFSNVVVNKTAGSVLLTGNWVINNDLTVTAGTLDLATFQSDRSNAGGVLTFGPSTLVQLAGTNNFPANFVTNNIDTTNTVGYNGSIAQTVHDVTYGNLTFSNGAALSKTMSANMQVSGNLLINAGATLNPNSTTITLKGNFTNNGTYLPASSTLLLRGNGAAKTFTGTTTLYSLTVTGSYVVASGTVSMAGDLYVDNGASMNFGSNAVSLDGDLTNRGSLTSNGTATFTGTRVQTLQLINALTSASTGVVNFNGTVAPVLNSTTPPTFATVNINNTAGITPSVPWTVYFSCTIGAGSSFHGGALTHTFYGNFTNNGTVTSSGELKFTPSPPFSAGATIQLDGTSFNSTGKVTFGGTSPITVNEVNPYFTLVNITNTNAAGVTAPNNWTINDELTIGAGATFNCGTGLSHMFAGNVTNNGTLDGQTSTVTFTGNPVAMNGLGTYTFYNLTISATADILLNRAINITKDFVVNGTFSAPGRNVRFSGTTSSVISGSVASLTLDDMEQDKTSGTTTFSLPVLVTGELTMTNGIINTTAVNLLSLADNAVSTPGTSTSFVDGPMKKTGDDAFVFPLGNGGYWARLEISAPATVTDAFTAQYFAAAYSNTTSMAASPSPALHNVSAIEYWTCNRVAGASGVTVKLYWESASRSSITNLTSDLVVARWNGSAWENAGQSAITVSNPGDITSNSNSAFGPFTFGSLNGSNPLPIELLSFNASVNSEENVDVVWTTASETNNDFFTVEKTLDGIHFETVAIVDGAGNSTQHLHYAIIDTDPYDGVSYYRLKQTDFNGMCAYSDVVAVDVEKSTAFSINVFPNPGNGAVINLEIDSDSEQEVVVTITDVLGKQCYNEKISTAGNGKNTFTITPVNQLIPGIYFVSVNAGGKELTQRMMIK
jgi:hypothetical protein